MSTAMMKDEYHNSLSKFFEYAIPRLRECGQHDVADRAERLLQDLPGHDSIAETRWQQRREIFEIISEEMYDKI